MKKWLFKIMVELTGNRIISSLLKKVTTSKWSRLLNKQFTNVYRINLDEMELPLSSYHSLHELFTRKLKEGARPIDSLNSLISPVDGMLNAYGSILSNATFTVKKQLYTLEEMLGSKELADKYKNGYYLILYLSPRHYHRIHSPLTGDVVNQWKLGGKSYPVNRLGLKYGTRPLATNYRLITEIKNDSCQLSVVKVGALNINSIHYLLSDSKVVKGEEMAYFSFGSTVILLWKSDNFSFEESLQTGMELRVGEKIGEFASS